MFIQKSQTDIHVRIENTSHHEEQYLVISSWQMHDYQFVLMTRCHVAKTQCYLNRLGLNSFYNRRGEII